jgi:PKD repeat protein
MRYFYFGFITSFLFSFNLAAQKHDYNWMSGVYDNFLIDFSDLNPKVYPINSQYSISLTMTFMSNFDGKAAFYSNGCTIQNSNHELIENGESLLQNDYFCNELAGNMNFPHSAGVTLPGFSPDNYIMFSLNMATPLMPQPCQNSRIVTHYIDMSANQGKGKVTQKDQLLLEGCFQEPTANRHANGRDWWILAGDNQQGKFYRWLFTPLGLQGPWVQIISNPTVDGYWYCGWSEFSSNGERYLVNSCRTGTAVYDFDRCTGLLSNLIFLEHSTVYNESATFSPDSRLLYTVDNILKEFVQYDLTATNISASRKVISIWDGTVDSLGVPSVFGFMQQGPDGKLYIWAGTYFMHIVDFPNRIGIDCSVRQRAIQLPGICFAPSLYYPRYRLGPIDNSSCDTLGINNLPQALFRYDLEDTLNPLLVTFTDVSSYEPTNWHWDFGDGSMSQDTNPVHDYTLPGAYQVCLIVSNAYAADTFCRQVLVGISGIHELPALPQAQVMPNPFTEEIQIVLPALVGVQPRFELFDLYGRNIANQSLQDFETRLSLPGLPGGIYFWKLLWNGVQTQSGKLVKQ